MVARQKIHCVLFAVDSVICLVPHRTAAKYAAVVIGSSLPHTHVHSRDVGRCRTNRTILRPQLHHNFVACAATIDVQPIRIRIAHDATTPYFIGHTSRYRLWCRYGVRRAHGNASQALLAARRRSDTLIVHRAQFGNK